MLIDIPDCRGPNVLVNIEFLCEILVDVQERQSCCGRTICRMRTLSRVDYVMLAKGMSCSKGPEAVSMEKRFDCGRTLRSAKWTKTEWHWSRRDEELWSSGTSSMCVQANQQRRRMSQQLRYPSHPEFWSLIEPFRSNFAMEVNAEVLLTSNRGKVLSTFHLSIHFLSSIVVVICWLPPTYQSGLRK